MAQHLTVDTRGPMTRPLEPTVRAVVRLTKPINKMVSSVTGPLARTYCSVAFTGLLILVVNVAFSVIELPALVARAKSPDTKLLAFVNEAESSDTRPMTLVAGVMSSTTRSLSPIVGTKSPAIKPPAPIVKVVSPATRPMT